MLLVTNQVLLFGGYFGNLGRFRGGGVGRFGHLRSILINLDTLEGILIIFEVKIVFGSF